MYYSITYDVKTVGKKFLFIEQPKGGGGGGRERPILSQSKQSDPEEMI